MKKIIYAIDDEKDIREILKVNLEKDGYDILTFPSAEKAMTSLAAAKPDIILLDIMMPGIDGYEFCKQLRAKAGYGTIPVIFLSARSEEFDKVLGLELGGDDYITKPFSIKELKSRIKAVLRRADASGGNSNSPQKIQYRGVELFPEYYSLKVDSIEVELTKTEFGILEIFLRNPGKIFTRDNIIDSIKGRDVYVVDRTVDVHIMNLRKKLGTYKNIIKTFSGVGYGFKE
jgi:two-component system alkaline phosphatase synthesis response regulator PhoP